MKAEPGNRQERRKLSAKGRSLTWITVRHMKNGWRARILMKRQKQSCGRSGRMKNEIKERFYTELSFGTAGLRGIIGAGINRMNIYTVRKATQGLANYILKEGGAAKGVAIAYDSRRMSPEFADEAALCLAANGIRAYVFESLRPTPELSYAVRTQ